MKQLSKRQEGQSIVIIAFALVALVALLALVVDAGNAYVQRRKIQNALDAGAQAGALQLAQSKTNGAIADAIDKFTVANGLAADPGGTKAYYVVQAPNPSDPNIVVKYINGVEKRIRSYGQSYPAPVNLQPDGYSANLPVIGVQVEGSNIFLTYFAGVVGRSTMQVSGGAAAFASRGACSAANLFPIVLSLDTFSLDAQGLPHITFEQDDPNAPPYTIWEAKPTTAGNFGWLGWNGDTGVSTLATNINDAQDGVTNSGTWHVGDDIPGTKNPRLIYVSSNIQWFIDNQVPVTLPVYESIAGSGDSATYHVKAFARFKITARGTGTGCTPSALSSDTCIKGKFQKWVDATAEGGCTPLGISGQKDRSDIDVTRSLIGSVKIQKVTLTQSTPTNVHVPVDVVNILDISGSMNDSFGSKTKIRAAKDALEAFNKNMRPDLGDQSSLATFPKETTGSSYSYSCTQSGHTTTYYFAEQRMGLTNNITGTNGVNSKIESLSANSGTSTAAGLQQGRQTVLGTGHQTNHVAVMILASDGLANMRLDGTWTGFQGSTSDSPTCNADAVNAAIDQANIAKGDTNPHDYNPDTIIFAIALGDQFNPAALQAIATADTDANLPHYYRATDANTMATIYQKISDRVQQIGSETCEVIPTEAFAAGATVHLRNQSTGATYTLQTTASGEFVLTNAAAGTYEIQSATVSVGGFTYDVFTDGLGGPVLTSNPTVTVGTSSGTYKTEVFLKTDDPLSCGH